MRTLMPATVPMRNDHLTAPVSHRTWSARLPDSSSGPLASGVLARRLVGAPPGVTVVAGGEGLHLAARARVARVHPQGVRQQAHRLGGRRQLEAGGGGEIEELGVVRRIRQAAQRPCERDTGTAV